MSDDVDSAKEEYANNVEAEFVRLAEYRNAVAEEFKGKTLDDPDTPIIAKNEIVSLIPDAAVQLAWLINHAQSESIRKDISKWVFDLAMKSADKTEGESALEKLLSEITKNAVDDD